MSGRFERVAAILRDAIDAHAFPGACIEVGRHDRVVWNAALGRLTYDPDAPSATAETVFDLASLTKVIATTTLVMRHLDAGRLKLQDPVVNWLRYWRGQDRETVTVGDLLAHSSGLSAYLPFYRDYTGRAEFEHAICTLPLEYTPRTQAVYSDLGFMLLGFIVEDAAPAGYAYGGAAGAFDPASALAEQFHRIAAFLTPDPLTFNPPRAWRSRCAPTEIDPWRGRLLVGEVHDENCWALGGAAGHAGLFGTAAAVGSFGRAFLRTVRGELLLAQLTTVHEFIRKREVPGSSRALGWDTMLPSSSCGTLMSPTAVGHTGFTGTSLWIDWERDLYVVLLTNRVNPTRDNNAIREVRPKVHDAVIQVIGT
jgi:CubicO group peptidase (beta-lactamase class C family)